MYYAISMFMGCGVACRLSQCCTCILCMDMPTHNIQLPWSHTSSTAFLMTSVYIMWTRPQWQNTTKAVASVALKVAIPQMDM